MNPYPPASETAAVNAGVEGPPAIGAWTIGNSLGRPMDLLVIVLLASGSRYSGKHYPAMDLDHQSRESDAGTSSGTWVKGFRCQSERSSSLRNESLRWW